MVDDSWHLVVDGTSDLSFGESPRSGKSLRRQCVENSSVGTNYYDVNVMKYDIIKWIISLFNEIIGLNLTIDIEQEITNLNVNFVIINIAKIINKFSCS